MRISSLDKLHFVFSLCILAFSFPPFILFSMKLPFPDFRFLFIPHTYSTHNLCQLCIVKRGITFSILFSFIFMNIVSLTKTKKFSIWNNHLMIPQNPHRFLLNSILLQSKQTSYPMSPRRSKRGVNIKPELTNVPN
ncbi:hypothetical protein VIGAN_08047100 [Vigna angularis var. angularis]|uniref:Uncharacterized protein n=1 Tax=Vigna angularis var. angularis TaxID=157739 RepID=A0A0S3SM74_PHAAN|nr:hypothetical protein VIGAN_08047100 [Vigna angularis var. angularis]